MTMDNQICKDQLEERFEAILSAIQILSPVKSATINHADNSERLARNYIINKILEKLDKEKREIIQIQSNKKKQLADEIIMKLDEFIMSLSNTKEMKSYIGHVILEDYLGKMDLSMEKGSPSLDNIDNGHVQPEESIDEDKLKENNPLSDLEDDSVENVIDLDSEERDEETIEEFKFDCDTPIREIIYSDDEEETSRILDCFYIFLLNKRHSSAKEIKEKLIEIFQFYNLDIKEFFSNVETKGELFDAYKKFRDYTAINFLPKYHREEMLDAFKCYINYLLAISGTGTADTNDGER